MNGKEQVDIVHPTRLGDGPSATPTFFGGLEKELQFPALLRRSADGRISLFPRRIYPMAFVAGMPRAV
jgi:hypothetical protein